MNILEELTKDLGGKFKPFKQANYVSKIDDERYLGGVCYALSAIYLSRYNKSVNTTLSSAVLKSEDELTEEDALKGMTFSQVVASSACTRVVQQLQNVNKSWVHTYNGATSSAAQTVVESVLGPAAVYLQILASLGQKGLQKISGRTGAQAPFLDLIKFVTKQDGRHLLMLPRHAIAVVTDSQRPKYKLFDPNFGQAIFQDRKKFKALVWAFLNNIKISQVYTLNKGIDSCCASLV